MARLRFLFLMIAGLFSVFASADVNKTTAHEIFLIDNSVYGEIPRVSKNLGTIPDVTQVEKISRVFEQHVLYSSSYGSGRMPISNGPNSVIVEKSIVVGEGHQNDGQLFIIPAGSVGSLEVLEKTLPDQNYGV